MHGEGRAREPIALALAVLLLLGAAPAPGGVFERGGHDDQPYRLYVPGAARAGPATSRPLVVALHGCWQTPEDFARGTRLNEAAERRGLLVLYPAQTRRRNPSRCWNWFEPPEAPGGETGRLAALIAHVAQARGAAADRVVVVGLSAGGIMAVNLACTAPHLVAGVGVAAGAPYRCATNLGGTAACLRGAGADGASAAAACRAAMGPRARPVLETWLIPGMGHAWSGGDARGTHTSLSGPDATERMLDFLLD